MFEAKGVAEPALTPFEVVEQIFGEGGLLQQQVPGYFPRPEQMALVHAMLHHRLFRPDGDPFVSEAPCGTGKTFAYLVASLLSAFWGTHSGRVLVSTAGISLQEQLVTKDIPLVLRLLEPYIGGDIEVHLQKGLSNFLCPRKIHTPDEGIDLSSELARHPAIWGWVTQTLSQGTGVHRWWEHMDISRSPTGTLPPRLLPLLTSSSDECVGDRCAYANECPGRLGRAYAEMASRNVVVLNHHLFAALQYHKTPMSRGGIVIVDEAHELPAIVRASLTTEVTNDQWVNRLNRFTSSTVTVFPEIQDNTSWGKLLSVDTPLQLLSKRYSGASSLVPLQDQDRQLMRDTYRPIIQELHDHLQSARIANPAVEVPLRRLLSLRKLVFPFYEGETGLAVKQPQPAFYIEEVVKGVVAPKLVTLPLNVPINNVDIFVSATIRYDNQYSNFLEDLSQRDRAYTFTTSSPFNWRQQALVCFPRKHLISPKLPRTAYDAMLAKAAVDIVQRTRGRCLFACTSWSSVNAVATALRTSGLPYPVLVQGEAGKTQLIQEFKRDVQSVLVGTLSMWTGVDVPGEALSCLIIDKIPFRGGDDPWLEAHRQLDPTGWFLKRSLPQTANLMAQGFGRLVRATTDRGACIVLDPRICPNHPERKNYAGTIIRTVFPPGCALSFDLEDVGPWLDWPGHEGDPGSAPHAAPVGP